MTTAIKLEAILDYRATARLADRLACAADNAVLDASEVIHIGALAAQLILSASKPGSDRGLSVAVIQPSTGFTDGLGRLGIDPRRFEG